MPYLSGLRTSGYNAILAISNSLNICPSVFFPGAEYKNVAAIAQALNIMPSLLFPHLKTIAKDSFIYGSNSRVYGSFVGQIMFYDNLTSGMNGVLHK